MDRVLNLNVSFTWKTIRRFDLSDKALHYTIPLSEGVKASQSSSVPSAVSVDAARLREAPGGADASAA